jgi:putative ABC transport system substrate-binding protein
MNRRDTLFALFALGAAPPAARAQPPALPVIGFLSLGSREADEGRIGGLRKGLAEIGYVDGKNVAIEYRGAQYQYDRLPALAADLVTRQVTVIVVVSTQATLAAKAATTRIPIVFAVGGDPVQFGLVTSLSRPGGNLTGVYNLNHGIMGKRLELLHESVPAARHIAYLSNPTSSATGPETKELHEAAHALGVEVRLLHAASQSEIDLAFATLAKEHAVPLVISTDNLFTDRPVPLVRLAARHGIPAMYPYAWFPVAGGLMSYGADLPEIYRLVGNYAGKIFKGATPADLPVQQAVQVEFVINRKTAKTLGLKIPQSVLQRADRVIE